MAQVEKMFNLYNDSSDKEGERRRAVEAALELIRASVSSSANRESLLTEMGNLSKYADFIQKALVMPSTE